MGKHLSFLLRLEKYYFPPIEISSHASASTQQTGRECQSSNAIYLLFEQWKCLRARKLFSWVRNRNSSQPGTILNKVQETPWRLLSRSKNTLTNLLTFSILYNISWQICSEISWMYFSRLLCSGIDNIHIDPTLNKHSNYLIISGAAGPEHRWRALLDQEEVRAHSLTQHDSFQLCKYPNKSTGIIWCVLRTNVVWEAE